MALAERASLLVPGLSPLRNTWGCAVSTTRVLIADPYSLVREGTRRILETDSDVSVVGEAGDGLLAVESAQRLRPDVALMDIALPLLNGLEATRQIKSLSPETAVLILLAEEYRAYIMVLLETGAAGYLKKTASGRDLRAAVLGAKRGEGLLPQSIAAQILGHFVPVRGYERPFDKTDGLTPFERRLLALSAAGTPNRGLAGALRVAEQEVCCNFATIFKKLGVASRTEAIIAGLRMGLLKRNDLVSASEEA